MYTRDNYNKVKALIDQRRADARTLADARAEELRLISPEIKAVDEQLRGTGLLIFKTACEGGDILPIKEENQRLIAKRREIIKSIGYLEDYSDVQYTCKKCSDSGYVDTKMCSCFKEMLLTENIKSSGIGRLIEQQSFENFDMSVFAYDKDLYGRMAENVRVAKMFADGFGSTYRGRNLLLIGNTGTGKTHISTSIAKRVISLGYNVIYDSAQDIVSAFEADKFRSGYGAYEPMAEKYLDCELLIVDDLGAEFVNQFTISCLYNLFNTRRNRGLSTVISTNLSGTALRDRYEDRIYSRIVGSDYTVLLFGGKDHRLS